VVLESSTYFSGEDSELLRKATKRYRGKKCLEIGIGYGSNLVELANNYEELVGTDVQYTRGFEILKEGKLDLVVTDRATCFKNDVFDLVIANPPYLPSQEIKDRSVDGGTFGFEVPRLFLQEAQRVVARTGVILVVLSSETSHALFEKFCEENQLAMKEIASKRLFFESLTVYELRKSCKM
jgi:release factor glutamine methyltransferase